MSKIKKTPDKSYKAIKDHKNYLSRITKTLYYGKLSKTDNLSLPVTELATELFSEVKKGTSLERLHCYDAAKISRNACVSPCSLVLAMLYLERLKISNPSYLDKTTPSDLFLVSLMVSSKFLFDDGESDEVFLEKWAASGEVTVKELVQLERDFLKAIDWEIYVSELTFWKKLNELETVLALRQGSSRGHFTYTELQKLCATIEIYNIIHCIIAVSMILAATYTAGIVTIAGSVFLASQVPGTSLYVKKLDNQVHTVPIMFDTEIITKPNDFCKTDGESRHIIRSIDVVDVLKTSILLASIKSSTPLNQTNNTDIYLGTTTNNAQYISWDYWNIPIMTWLAQSSQLVMNYTLELPVKYGHYYLETSFSNLKCIELEDQIHKGTKTRIQDQLEVSWHKEWTDMLIYRVFFSRLFPSS